MGSKSDNIRENQAGQLKSPQSETDEASVDSGSEPQPRSAKPATKVPGAEKGQPTTRLAVLLVIGAVLVVGGTLGFSWLQGRDLRKAAEALDAKEPDPQYAKFLLDQYLAKHPENTEAMALKARTLVMLQEDPVEALRLFEVAKAANAAEQHAWAKAMMMTQQWSPAAELLTEVLKDEPDNADALYEVTMCRLRTGKLPAARESAERLTKVAGQEAKGYLLLGSIERDSGNSEKAREYYARVLDYDKEAADLNIPPYEFFLDYGQLLVELNTTKDKKQARQAAEFIGKSMELQRVIVGRPSGETFVALGHTSMLVDRPDRAAEIWEQALVFDPGNVQARELLAKGELERGDPKKALEWLSPLENPTSGEISPGVTAEISYLFQRCHELLQNTGEADKWRERTLAMTRNEQRVAEIRRVLVNEPDSFAARVILAYEACRMNNVPQALAQFSDLAREDSQHPFVKACLESIKGKRPLPSLNDFTIEAPADNGSQ